MQRITISIDESLAQTFDALLAKRRYESRSEGVRDIVREAVDGWRNEQAESAHCVACLSYIYNPATRALASRLAELQQAHHDVVAATVAVRIDHELCLETVMLKGATAVVQAFADQVRAERGVSFGKLNLVGARTGDHHGGHGDHSHAGHQHYSPLTG